LYTEVNKELTAKKEANKIWKERIQKEKDENLSMTDYLEQTAILRAKRNVQKLAELHTCGHYDVDHFLDLEIPIEFSCEGASKSVEIAGTFNNWTPQPLNFNDDEGEWFTTLSLAPGVHYYKYVVDGEWMHNPSKECEEDEKGNINNVMRIEDKYSRSGPRYVICRDGKIVTLDLSLLLKLI